MYFSWSLWITSLNVIFFTPIVFASCIPRHEFQCKIDRSCISMKKWQDGVDDCYDGSDEVCLPWQFDCQFGAPRCIPRSEVNDNKIDCYSGFDEGCPAHFFVCRDKSHCIEPTKYLNGIPDCIDRSDEPCMQSQFQCADGSSCIPKQYVQDGKEHCKDGSDEECTASQFPCNCGAVRCVSAKSVLDGIWDCEDGSDEFMNSSKISCVKKYKLKNVLSVTKSELCSGSNSCKAELGQICVVIGGTWRCVCKLGTVRPPGSNKCIPFELLSRFRDTPSKNCSETNHEEFGLLKESKFFRKQNKFAIRRAPVQFSTKSTLLTGIDGFLASGAERVPFMFQENEKGESSNAIPDEIIDSYGTSPSFLSSRGLMDQCDPKNNTSCGLFETCRTQASGINECNCEDGFARVKGDCKELFDECSTDTHDCHSEAQCVDAIIGYECLCKEGYLDTSLDPKSKPGRKCLKLINECIETALNDCSQYAKCLDKPIGYTCR